MKYSGSVKSGVVVLDEPAALQEGTVVAVEIISGDSSKKEKTLASFAGALNTLPEDFAENHDHYLHGRPKK
jgi:hypothetical protein